VTITGRVRGEKRTFTVPVELPATAPENGALQSLWAREKIEELSFDEKNIPEITATALRYSLMSKYTSFVAVEDKVSVRPGTKTLSENEPVAMPEGTSYAAVGGAELSRTDIPPGYPTVSVKAPKDAR